VKETESSTGFRDADMFSMPPLVLAFISGYNGNGMRNYRLVYFHNQSLSIGGIGCDFHPAIIFYSFVSKPTWQ